MAFPAKATHQQTRAHNAALVLRALYDHGPISRADVARLTGLTRTTVGDVVGGLMGEGLAHEIGRGPSTGGKAPILLEVVDASRDVIGIDLGEFVFRAALLDLRGRVQRTVEREVGGLDGKRSIEVVHELVAELIAARRSGTAGLLGIGVGTPGIVDADTGTIRWAVNLEWHNLRLGELLAERYGVPVRVANDSRAAALALVTFSRPRPQNLVAIKVGRGIGAGLVIGSELFHGDGFGAGEIGHTVVDIDGSECRCGRFGCLETVASSRAIVTAALAAAREEPDSVLADHMSPGGELTLEDVRAALDAGDASALRVVVHAGRYLGQVIAGLIGVLDIERIVLHGSVSRLGRPWLDAVRDEARQQSLQLLSQDVSIELAPAIGDLVVMGASALLLTDELGLAVA